MPNLVLIGSIALDNIRTPHGEQLGILGGSATYAAYAAGLFTSTGIVAVVGDDLPQSCIEGLVARGIEMEGLSIVAGKTFTWTGYYDEDMAQAHTVDTQLGVFADFQPILPTVWRKAPFVFLGNIHPQLQLDVLTQLDEPRLVACDTMNFWIDQARPTLLQVIERVDLLFVNDAEARAITGKINLHRAAHELIALGPEVVVIKRGSHGASVYTQHETILVPAMPLKHVKDTTGAGDTFAGGMMGYIAAHGALEDDTLRRAAFVGSVMASFAVEDFSIGGLEHVSQADVERRYNLLRRMVTFGPYTAV